MSPRLGIFLGDMANNNCMLNLGGGIVNSTVFYISFLLFLGALLYKKYKASSSRSVILFSITLLISVIITQSGFTPYEIINPEFLKTSYMETVKKDVKISASLSDISPTKNSTTYLTVKGPPGGKIEAICQYKDKSVPFYGSIDNNGKGIIPINVMESSPNVAVTVDVIVKHKGNTYKTIVYFNVEG